MIGRIAWCALLAIIAGVAICAQIDRTARFDARYAAIVPAAFSGFASEQRTRLALAGQAPQAALEQARLLLRLRPLPAENLTLFAVAAAINGDAEAATAALEAASTRGWREPATQRLSALAALEAGNAEIAALRISALLATGDLPEETDVLAAQLMTTAQGRQALADRFVAGGHWQANALGRLAGTANPDDFAAMLSLALDQGADLPCAKLAQVARIYERQGRAAAAAPFWPRDCL